MIDTLPAHAVTPCDNRTPARPAPPTRESSMRALNLALSIADDAVRSDIEAYSVPWMDGGHVWNDTSKVPEDMRRHADDRQLARDMIERSLDYIGLRNPDGMPWRFIRHPDRPELVRFEGRS